MTHKSLLDKFASKHLAYSIESDIARLTYSALSGVEHGWVEDPLSYILSRLFLRWNCLLKKPNINDFDKCSTELALAVILHKYGFSPPQLTKAALDAVEYFKLNDTVSDEFRKKTNQIRNFINSKPVELKRLPEIPECVTFYRAGDVVCIQMEDKYYPAYVHDVLPGNECPVIEFYSGSFDYLPKYRDIELLHEQINNCVNKIDHEIHLTHFAVYGMQYLPDPANQIHLIKSAVSKKPSDLLAENTIKKEGYSNEDLFSLQLQIKLFSYK